MSSETQKMADQTTQWQHLQDLNQSYSYDEETISFVNKAAGISLAGTLTVPHTKKIRTTVILIAGYGKNDRDNTMMGHRPFALLADYLAGQGISVFRFDKRGVRASEGTYETATSEDFAQDVRAAVEYLVARQGVERSPIGLIGFSEGGLLASMVAASSSDVAYTILMAPALITDVDSLVDQIGLQLQADGATPSFIEGDRALRRTVYSIVIQEPDVYKAQKMIRLALEDYFASLSESQKAEGKKLPFAFTPEKAEGLTAVFNGPWYRFFLTYDTRPLLASLKVPTLIVTGGRDWILSSSRLFPFVSRHFDERGFKDYTLVDIPDVNHSFQSCKTGALSEYATSKETMSPVVLNLLSEWIKKLNL